MNFREGQTIGSYKLLHHCGSGAYGSVYYAENTVTHHFFALKILNVSEKVSERELRGLSNYKNCRHPNLLQIHHIEKTDEIIFYTMDAADNVGDGEKYIPDTLSRRLEQKKTLPVPEILKMANELLDGLAFLHKQGLVHRDIKPDNILWIDGKATLGDIGLTAHTENTSFAGTPGFISDSLLRGKKTATPDDDLYALGKVIYCALTGCSPREYPHYPGDVTISDAGPLIKTYTSVCESPSSVSSSEEMKKLLNSTGSSGGNYCCSKTKYIIAAVCVAVLLIIGIFYSIYDKKSETDRTSPVTQVVQKQGKLIKKTSVQTSLITSTPSDAVIVSELELIYDNRSKSRFVAKVLKEAEDALKNLEVDVAEKLRELNKHKMNRENYILARNAIFQAKREHIAKDTLCQIALKEKEIQKFLLTRKSAEISVVEIENLKKMLDFRQNLMEKLSTGSRKEQKKL